MWGSGALSLGQAVRGGVLSWPCGWIWDWAGEQTTAFWLESTCCSSFWPLRPLLRL